MTPAVMQLKQIRTLLGGLDKGTIQKLVDSGKLERCPGIKGRYFTDSVERVLGRKLTKEDFK